MPTTTIIMAVRKKENSPSKQVRIMYGVKSMKRRLVSLSLILTDVLIVAIIPFLSLWLRFEGNVNSVYYNVVWQSLLWVVLVKLAVFFNFHLYNRLWRYASIHEAMLITLAVTASSLLAAGVLYWNYPGWPRSLYILDWAMSLLFIGASRMGLRIVYYFTRRTPKGNLINVLIVGAGDAGAMLAREIQQRYSENKRIIGFIDDSPYKKNQFLFGASVLGTCHDIIQVVNEYEVDEIIIAMPSVSGKVIKNVAAKCKATKCQVKTLPGIYELIDGKVTLQQLRKIDLEDLLGRDPIMLDLAEIAGYLKGKRVLVTGAGGSIGSELCRQIAKMSPNSLYLLGKGENSIYEINQELRGLYNNFVIEPIIADVRDSERINSLFSKIRPQVVFHAAAHKHVPLMEAQPVEAVRNNIFGTKVVAEAANIHDAERFVMISTDKAVNPTSVMGATKRIAELIIQSLSKVSKTKFVAVRFGNVLGSRGSVVPLFKRQIAQGGPVTITHPDMQRYFMTIPEAAQLVLQAGAIAKGGEVFVLDMGQPVKIVDMACDLIKLSGLVPYKDIKIEFSGLRPGEKLFEELLTAEEGTTSTKHEKIYIANLKVVDEEKLQMNLRDLQSLKQADEIIKILSTLIPTYQTTSRKNCGMGKLEKKVGAEVEENEVQSIINVF